MTGSFFGNAREIFFFGNQGMKALVRSIYALYARRVSRVYSSSNTPVTLSSR